MNEFKLKPTVQQILEGKKGRALARTRSWGTITKYRDVVPVVLGDLPIQQEAGIRISGDNRGVLLSWEDAKKLFQDLETLLVEPD